MLSQQKIGIKNEIKFLFKLLNNFIDHKIDEFNKNDIKLKILGNINIFNLKLKNSLNLKK